MSEIVVPYTDGADDLIKVAALTRHIADPEEKAIARRVALDAAVCGITTAEELINELGAMSGLERRKFLDSVRAELGLRPLAEVEADDEGGLWIGGQWCPGGLA